jgi:hypothetical protein
MPKFRPTSQPSTPDNPAPSGAFLSAFGDSTCSTTSLTRDWNIIATLADVDAARAEALERATDWGEAFVVESVDGSFYEEIEDVDGVMR